MAINRAVMAKNIMIDGRNLGLEKGTGVATYARNLSDSLMRLGYFVDVLYDKRSSSGMSDLMKEISFFDQSPPRSSTIWPTINHILDIVRSPLGYRATKVPISGAVVYENFKQRLPHFDRIQNVPSIYARSHLAFSFLNRLMHVHPEVKPDLMHWTYPLPMRIPKVPNIYTLHDLVPLRLPFATLDNKRNYFRLVSEIIKSADHIVTVSESSKRDIVELLGVSEEMVTNTYQAVSIPEELMLRSDADIQSEIEGVFGLDFKGYFFFWGALEPKKNLGRMLEAYLGGGISTPLVIAGAPGWMADSELRLLTMLKSNGTAAPGNKVKNKVIHLQYLPFELLISLIRGAKAAVFPSLYEGFGLPVLEAMLLGAPVLTSTTSSLPEITGGHAVHVNPYSVKEIRHGLQLLDRNSSLRDELSIQGKMYSNRFSQEAYNRQLSAVYSRFI